MRFASFKVPGCRYHFREAHQALHLLLLVLKEVLVDCILLRGNLLLEHAVAKHIEGKGVCVAQDAPSLKQLVQRLQNRTRYFLFRVHFLWGGAYPLLAIASQTDCRFRVWHRDCKTVHPCQWRGNSSVGFLTRMLVVRELLLRMTLPMR